MSKITFRADDDLIRELEEFDASKSEVMREALRTYLGGIDGAVSSAGIGAGDTIDDVVADRVHEIIDGRIPQSDRRRSPRNITVTVALDGEPVADRPLDAARREDASDAVSGGDGDPVTDGDEAASGTERNTCTQCGSEVSADHVYCPNCGEKASHRVFCECGDELRSDWSFCPGCGRRTPAADVLDRDNTA